MGAPVLINGTRYKLDLIKKRMSALDSRRLCAITSVRPETDTTVPPPRHPCERFIARAPMVPTVGAHPHQ